MDDGTEGGVEDESISRSKEIPGRFDEYLNPSLELYEIIARICRLSEYQTAKGFPVILEADALNFYLTNCDATDSYAQIVDKFLQNYVTSEQIKRVLIN